MKLKHLFLALVAGVAVLASCKQEKPVFGITADVNALSFTPDGATKTIQVSTGQSWKVTKPATATWLDVTPSRTAGSTTLSVTTLPNEKKRRKAVIKIDAGMAGYVSVTITQDGLIPPGDGLTLATAWSPSEAKDWITSNLPNETNGTELTGSGAQKYWIKGYIHKMGTYNSVEQYFKSNDYGNASFYISDSLAETGDDVNCYQVKYLGNKEYDKTSTDPDVKVGDEVVIYGPVANFKEAANTLGKGAAFIYSLNGTDRGGAVTEETDPTGDGTLENPYNAAGAIQYIKSTTYDANARVYVTGVISDAEYPFDTKHRTATFSISEDGANYKTQFKCYGTYYLGNNPWIEGYGNIQNGDRVVVYGKVFLYATSGIYETVDKESYLVSLNDKTEAEPAFEVPVTQYAVSAATTEVDIDVYGTVEWTATASAGAEVTPDIAAGKVKVTFPENTDEAAGKTYTVTIATEATIPTATKSYTVTVSQGRSIAGGGVEVIFNYDTAKDLPTSGAACSQTLSGVKLDLENGARNTTAKDIRIYKGKKMTISLTEEAQTGNITSIVLSSAGGDNGPKQFGTGAPANLTIADDNKSATWSGASKSVEFVAVDAQVRMTEIRVIYIP